MLGISIVLSYVLIYMNKGIGIESLILVIYTSLLIRISMIDMKVLIIPDKYNLGIAVVGCLHTIFVTDISLLSRGVGFLIISVPMLLLTVCMSGAFGGGDIKLMAASGILLGMSKTIIAGFIGVLIGGFWGIYILSKRNENQRTHMAFGPCLAIGCFISLLYGEQIAKWYIGLL